MMVLFESRVAYHEVILKGAFADRDSGEVSTRFEAFLAGSPPEEASYACILLNLREATLISRRVFSVLVGYAALFRLRGKATVAAWPTEVVRGFIDETRTSALLIPARDETEACQAMVHSVHREYTPDFFAFLVHGQYLTKDQLRGLTNEHRALSGKVPMERLLIDAKIFSWKTLLAAHVRYRQLKQSGASTTGDPGAASSEPESPAPAKSGGLIPAFASSRAPAPASFEEPPAPGMFGPPVTAGKPAPKAELTPDAFQAAVAAGEALGANEPPVVMESEFVQPRLLGRILIELKILDEEKLKQALDRQREEGRRAKLGDLLIRMGLVTDDQLFRALEQQFRRRTSPAPRPGAPGRSEFVTKNLLGEILLELGLVSEKGLKEALDEQRNSPTREKLGTVLLRLGLVTREQMFTALEAQANRKTGSFRRPAVER